MKVRSLVERAIRRTSIHGDPPYYELEWFPWIPAIERQAEAILAEFDAVWGEQRVPDVKIIHPGIQTLVDDGTWKMFPFYHRSLPIEPSLASCPVTASVLRTIPDLAEASFSVFPSNTELKLHRGPYNGLIRYHLGLRIPPGGHCAIEVSGVTKKWENGQSLVFDDSHNHRAWNRSGELRVIFMATFARPLPPAMQLVNRAAMRAMAVKHDARGNIAKLSGLLARRDV